MNKLDLAQKALKAYVFITFTDVIKEHGKSDNLAQLFQQRINAELDLKIKEVVNYFADIFKDDESQEVKLEKATKMQEKIFVDLGIELIS